jgi:hypothetical protein
MPVTKSEWFTKPVYSIVCLVYGLTGGPERGLARQFNEERTAISGPYRIRNVRY